MLLDDINSKYTLISAVLLVVFFSAYFLNEYLKQNDYLMLLVISATTLYAMTVLPGWTILNKNSVIVVALCYFIWFISKFNFSFLVKKMKNFSFWNAVFVLQVLSLVLSILVFNLKDFFQLIGFAKIIVLTGSAVFFGLYIPSKINQNPELMQFIVKGLVYSGLFASIGGLITIISNVNPYSSIPNSAISFFAHVNLPTFLYMFSVPAALYSIFFRKNDTTVYFRFLLFVSVILMILNVFFTYNRAGIIAISVGIGVLTLFYSRKILIGMAILVVPMLSVITTIFLTKGTATVLSRLSLYLVAFEMMQSSLIGFLFGFGIETNYLIFHKIKIANSVIDMHDYPHNSYIFFILQFGVIPLALTLLSFLILLYKVFSLILKKKGDNQIYLSLSIVLSVAIYALFEDFFLFPENFMYHFVWLFLGILYVKIKSNNTDQ